MSRYKIQLRKQNKLMHICLSVLWDPQPLLDAVTLSPDLVEAKPGGGDLHREKNGKLRHSWGRNFQHAWN